jgi:hypothetical protein
MITQKDIESYTILLEKKDKKLSVPDDSDLWTKTKGLERLSLQHVGTLVINKRLKKMIEKHFFKDLNLTKFKLLSEELIVIVTQIFRT